MLYQSEAGNIRIALTGDSMITRPMSIFNEPGFLGLVDLLRSADVAVTNAEMLFNETEDPAPTYVPGGSHMQASPRIIDELQWLGISMVATANNHGYDFGENGLVAHLKNLDQAGMAHAGMGHTLGEARSPRYLDTPNGRVALLSVTSSGPPALFAQHQWRDGRGRPGANMIRHTTRYTVDDATFHALRRMNDELGLGGRSRSAGGGFRNHTGGESSLPDTDTEFFMGELHDHWQYPVPYGCRIALGETFGRVLIPNARDIEENLQRISDAKRQADWVVVSMHNHEQGLTIDEPSNVAVTFAHAAIDAGADIFHGHGPHRDRGIEIYKGRPIFYSIGHFVFQMDTVAHLAHDNILRQGLDPWESTPADFYDTRSGPDKDGAWVPRTSPQSAWRDIVAVVDFEDRKVAKIVLHPIEMGYRRARAQRGRPVLASAVEGAQVLKLFQQLSQPYGTEIEVKDGVGVVTLPPDAR